MHVLRSLFIVSTSGAAVLLWTSCSCDPGYPPEAGESCEVVGERACSPR